MREGDIELSMWLPPRLPPWSSPSNHREAPPRRPSSAATSAVASTARDALPRPFPHHRSTVRSSLLLLQYEQGTHADECLCCYPPPLVRNRVPSILRRHRPTPAVTVSNTPDHPSEPQGECAGCILLPPRLTSTQCLAYLHAALELRIVPLAPRTTKQAPGEAGGPGGRSRHQPAPTATHGQHQ